MRYQIAQNYYKHITVIAVQKFNTTLPTMVYITLQLHCIDAHPNAFHQLCKKLTNLLGIDHNGKMF